MSLELMAQLVGFIAVVFSLAIYQVNKRSLMLWLGLIAGSLFSLHFLLLGALTGAVLNLIGIARSYAFIKIQPSKHNLWVLMLFIGIAATVTILTWQGLFSLLAFFGNSASGVAFWQSKPRNIRRLSLISPPLWFSYNAISGSYPGMFIEVANFISVLVGRRRFDVREQNEKL